MMVVYEGNSFVCEVYGEIFIIFLVVKVRIGLGWKVFVDGWVFFLVVFVDVEIVVFWLGFFVV